MAWLRGLTAADLGISFENGRDFAATQEMTEEIRQEVAYQGAFGTDGPVLRRVRAADEGSLSFSVILLRTGQANHMNDELLLKQMRDFDIQCERGNAVRTYRGCNWNRISVRSTLDQVTLDCDVSVPGYAAPLSAAATVAPGRIGP
jgi:hypothetical protein